jgi:hypothetical protein
MVHGRTLTQFFKRCLLRNFLDTIELIRELEKFSVHKKGLRRLVAFFHRWSFFI